MPRRMGGAALSNCTGRWIFAALVVRSVTDTDKSMGRWIFAASVMDSITCISGVSDALGRWIMAASVLGSGNDIRGVLYLYDSKSKSRSKDIMNFTINIKKHMMNKTCLRLNFRDLRVCPLRIFTEIVLILVKNMQLDG